jgi:nitric oxide dioxygenase
MLKRYVPNLNADFYSCGPIPFLRAIKYAWNELGVPAQQQKSEAFTPDPSFLMKRETIAA